MGLRAARAASVARMERRKSDVSDLRKFDDGRIREHPNSAGMRDLSLCRPPRITLGSMRATLATGERTSTAAKRFER